MSQVIQTKKKILFITPGFAPYEFSENIVNSKLVLALIKAGHTVDVIAKIDEGSVYSNAWIEPWKELRGFTIIPEYSNNKFNRFADVILSGIKFGSLVHGIRWASRAYDIAIDKINQHRYDLILTRAPSDIGHLVGLKLKKTTGLPWIANWNDPSTTIWPGEYKNKLSIGQKYFYSSLAKDVIKYADLITFPCDELRDHFLSHFIIDINKTRIIPHINLPAELTLESGLDKGCLKMCHAGNLSKERRPEKLLIALSEAIRNNPKIDITLDIIGSINDNLSTLITSLDLQNHVKSVGSMSFQETMTQLNQYDLLIVVEAPVKMGIFLPSKVVDYSQINKPIFSLSPVRGCMSRLMTTFGGGLVVDNDNPKEISDGLQILINAWKTGDLTEKYNSQLLNSNFTVPGVIHEYEEAFDEISNIEKSRQ